eukprot:TRINITY_DN7903_c0_g1_i1.p1 TRINITY_DN7903_c0_g1~~TRINITY_DN7903_c0_g1_i1.p1  ORF type:complete len:148 (+),score=27.79 TRINITY_DN7903_c0_g1_i1:440-883(+)
MWHTEGEQLRQVADPGYMLNCDPALPHLAALHPAWCHGACICDATSDAGQGEANCVIIASPYIDTMARISKSASEQTAMLAAYVVVTKAVLPGQELRKHCGTERPLPSTDALIQYIVRSLRVDHKKPPVPTNQQPPDAMRFIKDQET